MSFSSGEPSPPGASPSPPASAESHLTGPLHIGLVRRGYSASGGAESYLRRVAEALRNAGHEPILFCGPEWREVEWAFGEKRIISGRSPAAFATRLQAEHRGRCDRLFSLERVWSCDCYRAGDGVHRSWLKQRARYEPAWRSWFRSLNPKHRQILSLEESLFRGGAQDVIANSRMVRDEICREFGFPSERIHVVYNGLPPAPLPPSGARDETRTQLGAAAGDCVLLFAGSGWERKGLRYAIDAVRRVRDRTRLRFVVAGRGGPRKYARTGEALFLGPVKDVPRLLEAADVFILPTLYDPFSNACLEALAAGLPVITTAQNGFSEIIRSGEEGEVIGQPEDITALSHAIEKWMEPSRRAIVRAALRDRAREFSVAANVEVTLGILTHRAASAASRSA